MLSTSDQHIRQLASQFLTRLPEPDRSRAVSAMEHAVVKRLEETPNSVQFVYPKAPLNIYRGQTAIPVEARIKDDDGEELSVVAYLDEIGRLMEIEFIRWDSVDVIGPRWSTLKMW